MWVDGDRSARAPRNCSDVVHANVDRCDRSGRGLICPLASPSCGCLPHDSEDDVTERVATKTWARSAGPRAQLLSTVPVHDVVDATWSTENSGRRSPWPSPPRDVVIVRTSRSGTPQQRCLSFEVDGHRRRRTAAVTRDVSMHVQWHPKRYPTRCAIRDKT